MKESKITNYFVSFLVLGLILVTLLFYLSQRARYVGLKEKHEMYMQIQKDMEIDVKSKKVLQKTENIVKGN